MFRKILTSIGVVVFATVLSVSASQIPILSGPQDPSQMLATINQLIQSINAGVNGRLTAQVTATGTTTTIEQSIATYTLPANTLANPGDAVRVMCWGATASNNNSKNATLYFGTSSIELGGNTVSKIINNKKWFLTMTVMRSGAATQTVVGTGAVDATLLSTYTNAGTDSLTAAVTIKCTGSTPTAAQDITAQGFLVEQIK